MYIECYTFRPNSPAPLMDNWKVMDNSSVTFQSFVSGAGEFGLRL